jgi:hypothetical protein
MELAQANLERVIHISNVVGFHERVLLPCAHQLWECSQETLNADAAHVHKLARHQGLAGLGDQGGSKHHL